MSDDGSMEVDKKKKKKDKKRDTVSITADTEMSSAAATATTDEEDTESSSGGGGGEVDRAKLGIAVIAHPLANRKLTKKCLKLVKKGQRTQRAHAATVHGKTEAGTAAKAKTVCR